MEISQQLSIGLKRLTNNTLCNEECFTSILKNVALILTNQTKLTNLNELNTSKPDIAKECFASLLVLLVESSRHNVDPNSLISTLESYNISSPRTLKISELYQGYRSKFQASLELLGTSHPKLMNSSWRLDFCIKSSSLEHESRSIYLIQFVLEEVQRISYTKEKPKVKKITFTCSLQQLQELVTKLREATRLIQAIANNK